METTFIIKNIIVIDPTIKRKEKRDLFILDGKYVKDIPDKDVKVYDGEGLYATTGIIDIHTHVFTEHTPISINAEKIGIEQGVLTVVDAGSTGIRDFKAFNEEAIKPNKTEVLFFLNISRLGLCDGTNELSDLNNLMTSEELSNFQKENGKNLVGIKVRMSSSVVKENGIKPLIYAKALAEKANLPLMVHIGNAPPALDEVLNVLNKGDIVTHCFHGKNGGISDFPKEFKEAIKRGVNFDVGHGSSSFSYNTVEKIMAISPIDYSISTDLYKANYESPVGSLMNTMSKFMSLGVSLEDVIRKVTILPRKFLNLNQPSFNIGEPANLSIFKIVPEKIEYLDSEKFGFTANEHLKPIASIKNGEKVWAVESLI